MAALGTSTMVVFLVKKYRSSAFLFLTKWQGTEQLSNGLSSR
jgi:hypothetical protein